MVSPRVGCLVEEDLDRIAGGGGATAEESMHLEGCVRCRSRLEEAHRDADFLARVRPAVVESLGPDGAPRMPGYRVLDRVSAGAQGVVYRAIQESTSRVVAIKVLGVMSDTEGGSSRERRRAEREAEIAARMHHPNVVDIFESRVLSDGHIAMVMEFVDGVPVHEWTPPGADAEDRMASLLRVFVDICKGVHHAHLNGVIHRDLKPENVLVTPDGRPVVVDFGVARADGLQVTRTGEFAGTPAYASPEQVSGRPGNIDALTDVYSLGVILYRLLTGMMPYELHGSLFDIARTITESSPIPVRSRVPTIPHDLEAITLRALRKHRSDRYQSAAGMALDIERYLRGAPVEARSGSGWYVLRKAVSMNRGRVAWMGAIIALAGVAGIVVALALAGAAEAERRAMAQRDRARAVGELLREILPRAEETSEGVPILDNSVTQGLRRLHYRLETGVFADEPEVDRELRLIWAAVHNQLGEGRTVPLLPYAELSLRSGLVAMRTEYGPVHPEIASSLHALASVLRIRERLTEAESVCLEAQAMRTSLFGARSEAVAESNLLLAQVRADLGRGPEARAAAAAAASYFGAGEDQNSRLAVATVDGVHAQILVSEGRYAEAESYLRGALHERIALQSPDDPMLLRTLLATAHLVEMIPECELGRVLRRAYGESGAALTDRIARDRLVLLSPPVLAFSLRTQTTGRTAALQRILSLQTEVLDRGHPALTRTLMAIMNSAADEGEPEMRIEAALAAAENLRGRYGPDDPRLLVCLDQAVTGLAFSGQTERAVRTVRESMRIRETIPVGARDRLMHANAQRVMAWCLALDRDFEAAIPVYREASSALTGALGPDHYIVALSDAGLAYCLVETGRMAEAEALSSRAWEIVRGPTIASNDQVAHIQFVRAHTLARSGHHAAALPLFEEVWTTYYRFTPQAFPWRRELIGGASGSCLAIGDDLASAEWLNRTSPESVRAF